MSFSSVILGVGFFAVIIRLADYYPRTVFVGFVVLVVIAEVAAASWASRKKTGGKQ
jgi:hypothetical protein